MSNHSRRPVSSRPSGGVRPVTTKKVLEEFLGYDGWSLDVRKSDGVQYDTPATCTSYYAVTEIDVNGETVTVEMLLENAYPGDKRDWAGMFADWQRGHENAKTQARNVALKPDGYRAGGVSSMMINENRYFRVTKEIMVAVRGDLQATNEWLGRHRVHRAARDKFRLQPGDEIHVLLGGTFIITEDGESIETFRDLGLPTNIDLDFNEEITKAEATSPTGGYRA